MTRLSCLLALVGLILGLSISAFAGDQALLILKSQNYADTEATMNDLDAVGAHTDHVFPPTIMIAYVPADSEAAVKAMSNVATFSRTSVSVPPGSTADVAQSIIAWNTLLTNPSPAGEGPVGCPLVGDVVPRPAMSAPARTPVKAGLVSHAPDRTQTSSYLAGRITVGFILPESTASSGTAENWNTTLIASANNEVVAGLNWWVKKSRTIAPVTFVYDKHFSVATQYEPITMASSSCSTWMNDCLSKLGYADSWEYVNAIRNTYHTDWAFVVFVANSYKDTDEKFSDGYFAFTMANGPWVVMTNGNDGWGSSLLDRTMSHEMGHAFGASDEYCQPGYACCEFGYSGYLHVYNGNCETNNPASIDCVMKMYSDAICTYTNGQIGWTDSDSDGIPDVLDCPVNVALDPIPVPARLSNINFTGVANVVPCLSPIFGTTTINKISKVSYRIDGGEWLGAAASDGAYNLDVEQFQFTTPTLANGHHKVEVQAFSTRSGNSSDILTYEFDVTDPDPTPPTILSVSDGGVFTYDDSKLTCDVVATDPDSGVYGYQYAIGTTSTDPGTGYVRGWTYAGNDAHIVANGLQLALGQTYYIYVKVKNASDVWSSVAVTDGIEVADLTIGMAKTLPDGTWVSLNDKIVTGGFTWPYAYFYIQETDKSAGIRVRYDNVFVPTGSKVTVKGTLNPISVDTNNEREVQAIEVITHSTGNTLPHPLGVVGKSIGSGIYDAQLGVPLSSGLNNCGLYVRMVGKITRIESDRYYITDGSVCTYSVFENGVKTQKTKAVEVCIKDWPYQISVGRFIMVTGIAGIYAPDGMDTAVPMIKPRGLDDIIRL